MENVTRDQKVEFHMLETIFDNMFHKIETNDQKFLQNSQDRKSHPGALRGHFEGFSSYFA